MLVKCQICKNSIDRNNAFKVTVGKVNKYYCNENEYTTMQKEKELKNNTYDSIFECFGRKITNSALFKEISELEKVYGYEKIYKYMIENSQYISDVLATKSFSSEYGEIRYFAAILKNNLNDFIIENEQFDKVMDIDIPQTKFKSKKKRKPLEEFEDEI